LTAEEQYSDQGQGEQQPKGEPELPEVFIYTYIIYKTVN
jgi:hypothetical protein